MDLGTSTVQYVVGCIVLSFFVSICGAAGIGGGGLNVPILILTMGYQLKESQKLSYCVLIGNYLSQLIINRSKTHPKCNRLSVISFEIVLVLLPCQLAGNNLGALLNKIFPDSILYIIALFILLFCSCYTFMKGRYYYRQEISERENSEINKNLISEQSNSSTKLESLVIESDLLIEEDNPPKILYPWMLIAFTFFMWIIYVVLIVIREQLHDCSSEKISLLTIIFVLLPLISLLAVLYINNQRTNSSSNQVILSQQDMKFEGLHFLPPVIAIFIIGIICNLLGIGGSELSLPLLLYFGVPPLVASSTAPTMSIFSTGANLILYSSTGDIDWNAGGFLVLVGFFSGYFGRTLGLEMVRRFQTQSVLVFVLSLLLLLTCVFYIYELQSTAFQSSLSTYCQ